MLFCYYIIMAKVALLGVLPDNGPVNHNNILPEITASEVMCDRLDRIHMTDLDGRALTMADFAGKAVFLNFWATWCKPCITEMDYIQRLQDRYGQDIVFLAASTDELETIQTFQEQHGFTFQFVRLDVEYIDAFVISLPTTLLINRDGEIIHEEEGVRVWDSENFDAKVRKLL